MVPRRAAEVLLDALQVRVRAAGWLAAWLAGRRTRLAQATDQLLGLADGQVLLDDGAQDVVLVVDGQAAERPPVALA